MIPSRARGRADVSAPVPTSPATSRTSAASRGDRSRRRRIAPIALATATCAVLAATLAGMVAGPHAAADWARVGDLPGLRGGRVWGLGMNPGTPASVLAATDNGIYRSGDSGATWQPSGLVGRRAWTVGFDARASHPAFAGLDGGGVARSDDGGTTWKEVSAGLPDRHVRALAFGLSGLAAGTNDGVAVSDDGQTWRSAGLGGYAVSALSVSANTPQFTLIAGTDAGPGQPTDGFLFRNAGPGPNWELLAQGLPATSVGTGPRTVVSAIASGPLPQSTQSRPLLVTTNKGTFHSGDGGSTWSPSALPNPDPTRPVQTALTTAAFSPVDPNLVYAGNDAGGSSGGTLVRSTDSGANFTVADRGLNDQQHAVASLVVAPTTPPLILAGIDPSSGGGLVVGETDGTVPPPAPIAQEANAPAPATPGPAPKASAPPKPAAPHQVATGSSGLRRFYDRLVHWPLPLALEIFVLLLAAYILVRWRQHRLDVEGPP